MSKNDEYDALRCAESLEGKRVYDDSVEWAETLEESAAHLRRLVAENEALRQSVKKANDQAEHFERQWYLRGDKNEAQAALLRQVRRQLDRLALAMRVGMPEYGPEDLDEMLGEAAESIRQHLEKP